MATPATGAISMNDLNTAIGAASGTSRDLNWLKTNTKDAIADLNSAHARSWYKKTNSGNCNNGNCTTNCNCGFGQCICFIPASQNPPPWSNCNGGNCHGNCTCTCGGDRQCLNCNCNNCLACNTVNCVNCDATTYLQADCNCACTYNCTTTGTVSYNCGNCACLCVC